MNVPVLALPVTSDDGRSVAAILRRARSTPVVASPPLRYLAAALAGALVAGAASAAPVESRSSLLLLCFPAVGAIAGLAGVGAGIAGSAGAALGALLPGAGSAPLRLAEDALFWLTLALVALLVGRLADSLRAAHERAERERLEANEFAAALHLRLMLAEREIERQRGGEGGGPVAPPPF